VGRFTVQIKPSARRELENLNDTLLGRIVTKIDALSADPRPTGCKKLHGFRNQWRLRVGDYRIVYSIDDSHKIVDVIRIRHRRDVYES